MPRPGTDAEPRVRVGDVDLAVRDNGSGRPFVWAHGLLSSMTDEDEMGLFGWPRLTDVVRVVRYDARGHGRSSGTDDPEAYTWPSFGADMIGLLDALAIGRAVLGGASMGCAASLYAALQAPERVERLVLAIPPTAWATRGIQRLVYKTGAVGLTITGLRPLAATRRVLPVRRVMTEGYRRSPAQSLPYLRRSDRGTVAAILRGAGRSDLPSPGDLAALTMPALILAWRGDPGHPLSTARKLAEVLPNATLHTATSGADLLGWESVVRSFLSA